MSALDTVRRTLEDARARIGAARAQLNGEQPMDLQELEQGVDRLCADIAALTAEESRTLQPTMVALMDDLNALESELTSHHAELSHDIRDVSDRRRATAAYGKAARADPTPGK